MSSNFIGIFLKMETFPSDQSAQVAQVLDTLLLNRAFLLFCAVETRNKNILIADSQPEKRKGHWNIFVTSWLADLSHLILPPFDTRLYILDKNERENLPNC